MKSLPKISNGCICAVVEKVVLDVKDTVPLTTHLIAELVESGNESLATTLVELMDGILGDDVQKKMMVSCVVFLILKMVSTTIEAQEIENMFEETT